MSSFYKKKLFEKIDPEKLVLLARVWILSIFTLPIWLNGGETISPCPSSLLVPESLIAIQLEVVLQIILPLCPPLPYLLLLMTFWIYLIAPSLRKRICQCAIPFEQEIFNALSSIGSTKAHSRDGFTALFYEKNWNIINHAILQCVWDSFEKNTFWKSKTIPLFPLFQSSWGLSLSTTSGPSASSTSFTRSFPKF